MSDPAATVFAVAGSLRQRSFNRRLVRRAAALAPDSIAVDVYDDLGAIPLFDQDHEGDRTPAAVLELRDRIERSDALLIATPEYNSSIPGVLKNALDWASRPPGESVLADKPAAVMGASPGRYGAQRAQADVRKVLTAIGADVLEDGVAVPKAHEAFDDDGALRDADLDDQVRALVVCLVAEAGAPVPHELAASARYSAECQRLTTDR